MPRRPISYRHDAKWIICWRSGSARRQVFSFVVLGLLLALTACRNAPVSKEALVAADWGPEDDWYGVSIWFYPDDTFRIALSGMGGFLPLEGPYEIKDGKVTLAPTTIDYNRIFSESMTFTLRADEDSLFLTEKLVSNSTKAVFWNQSKPVPEGTKRRHRGTPVVTTRKQTLVLSDDLSIWDTPSNRAARLYLAQGATETIIPYLPRGYTVRVVARATDIPRGGVAGPWYLIHAMVLEYDEILVGGDLDNRYRGDLVWVLAEDLGVPVD